MEVDVSELKALEKLAHKISSQLKGGEVIALMGELGSGKTAFTKKFLKKAGVRKTVTSPTFVLMIPYTDNSRTFYHMDLYRLNSYKDIEALGVPDLWGKKENVFVIEWADKILKDLPRNTFHIEFVIKNSKRKAKLKNVPKHIKI